IGGISLLASQRTISHTSTLRLLGIDWTKYKVTGVYNYNSKGATSTKSTKGIVVRNLNPMVQTSNTSNQGLVSKGIYTGTSTFNYKIGPLKGLSVQIGTYNIQVKGNHKGKTSGKGWTSS
ncbi:hypothetical protein ACRE8H_26760, partial [Klebsiella pneumoniae]